MTTRPGGSIPACPDLRTEAQACRVRKLPVAVTVVFAAADGTVDTLEGTVWHAAGDAILTGVHGERWPVRKEAFNAFYDPVAPTEAGRPGAYIKQPVVALALRLRTAMMVPAGRHNDPLDGRPGDWLLRHEDGSHGVVCDDIFRATYERI